MTKRGQDRCFALRHVRLVGTPAAQDLVTVTICAGRVVRIAPHDRPVGDVADVIDLDGRFLVRGLWDHHVHFGRWATLRQHLDLTSCADARSVVDKVATALAHGVDGPLTGVGFRDGLWPAPPTRAMLDSVAASVPVILASADLHCAWLNSAAFTHLGLTDVSEDGIVREEASLPAFDYLRAVTAADHEAAVAEAAQEAATRGVVGVVDFENDVNLDAWSRRVQAGTTCLRVVCGIYAAHLDDAIDRGLKDGDVLADTEGLVRVGPFKVLVDGSLNTRTAYCFDPYPGAVPPDDHGLLTVPPEQLEPMMRRATEHGLRCAIHAIGDQANSLVLDAFERVGARGTIEHAQLVGDADFTRFARLGVVASVQPEHAVEDRDVADRHWVGRTGRAFAFRTLLDSGATLALGSDAPVAPLDPWVSIAAAVRRTADERPGWHAEQSITAHEALCASTHGRPLVVEGDRADLVVLDQDPLDAPASGLATMAVSGTMIDGRWTWQAL